MSYFPKSKEGRKAIARDNAMRLVHEERCRQFKKWGDQHHTDVWWLAILGEEFGELSQAILHDEFGGKAKGTTKAELVQCAAVCLQWIEHLELKEYLK